MIEYLFRHRKRNRFFARMTLALVVGDLLKRLDSFERRLRIVYPRLYTTIAL